MFVLRHHGKLLCRFYKLKYPRASLSADSYNSQEAVKTQNDLFDREKERQLSIIKRIEKIKVVHAGTNDACTLSMNKYLSTPYHVAMHLHKMYTSRSAIALVNGQPQHMFEPLTEDCEVSFVTMKDDAPEEANKAFWRSCAHMAGAVLLNAFKENVSVIPARAPNIPYENGCFAYDINLSIKWNPTREEMISLGRMAYQMAEKKIPFERLVVKKEVAQEIFQNNIYKEDHLDNIPHDRVILYRLGQFIDVNDGLMVTDTGFMVPYNFSFTAAHHFEDYLLPQHKLTRFQAVALPSDFRVSHVTWNIIEERAKEPVYIDLKPVYSDSKQDQEIQSLSEASST